MKKALKILAVLLSITVITGALALLSSADGISGVHVTAEGYFDDLDPSFTFSAADGNPENTGYAWAIHKRSGSLGIELSADNLEKPNQYLVIKNGPMVENKGPYWGTGYGGKTTAGLAGATARPTIKGGILSLNGTDIADWPYLVMDLDVTAPTANWSANVNLQMRSFLAGDTELDSVSPGANVANTLAFLTDAGGTYIADNTGNYKKYVNPDVFTHVTLIYESVAEGALRSVNAHVYLNGEHFFSHRGTSISKNTSADDYYASTPHANYDEIRFGWPATNNMSLAIGIDNVVTRLFDTDYNGNLSAVLSEATSLDSWDANIYDEDKMPLCKAVCSIGDVKYDNFEKAVANAEEGSVITLHTDINTPITVNKPITVNYGEYKLKLLPGEGLIIDDTTDGVYKAVIAEGMTARVVWDGCLHEPSCGDESQNHPLFREDAEVIVNKKLLTLNTSIYTGPVGNDGELYALIGWKNAKTGEDITEDTILTENDVENGTLFLAPVYKLIPRLFEYTQNGETVTVREGDESIFDVFANADATTTVKLLSDFTLTQTKNSHFININKAITFDLNGYTIKALVEGVQTKCSLFNLDSGADLTVTSSRPGGKIFNEGWNNAKNVGAAGVFKTSVDTAILRINGNAPDGSSALAIFSGNIIEAYANALEYHIDGGTYICTAPDQMGVFDVRKAGVDATVKNAFFYSTHSSGIISYSGRNIAVDEECNVTVDNCVFIGDTIVSLVNPVAVTMTNCYVTGNITPKVNPNYTTVKDGDGRANTPGKVILGDGNYVGGQMNENVILAEGIYLHDTPTQKEFSYLSNTWSVAENYKFNPESFIVEEKNASFTFQKFTATVPEKFTKIIFTDGNGNVLGESSAKFGAAIILPDNLKPAGTLVPGWLDYIPGEWNEPLVVPADVDEYVLTPKKDGEKIPVAAVEFYFNIVLSTHFEYRLYIPEVVSGIEITAVNLRGNRLSRYNSLINTKYSIGGKTYTMVDAWPGFVNAVEDNSSAGISFVYNGVEYHSYRTINMVDYCTYILSTEDTNDGTVGYTEKDKALAVNAANYLYRGLLAFETPTLEEGEEPVRANKVKSLVENYAHLIYSIDKENLTEPDTSAISPYVSGVELKIVTYTTKFRFNLTEAGKAAKVSLSTGAQASTDVEYADLGYIETNQTAISNIQKTKITVTPAGGSSVSFTFTFEDYYAALLAAGADELILATVDAMYGYAEAGARY